MTVADVLPTRVVHFVGGASKRHVSLNISRDQPALLREPSWADLEAAVGAFEAEVHGCAVDILTTRHGDLSVGRLSKEAREQPLYLAGEMVVAGRSAAEAHRINFTVADTAVLRRAAGFTTGGPRHAGYAAHPNTHILGLPWTERVAIVRRALGDDLRALRAAMTPMGAASIGLDVPDLHMALRDAASPGSMIRDILSGCLPPRPHAFIAPASRAQDGAGAFWPLLFLARLRLLGIALPPLRTRYLQLWRHPLARRFVRVAFTPSQAAIMETVNRWVGCLTRRNQALVLQAIQSLLLSSDVRSPEDLDATLAAAHLGSLLEETASSSSSEKVVALASSAFNHVLQTWNEANPDRPLLGFLDHGAAVRRLCPVPPGRLPPDPERQPPVRHEAWCAWDTAFKDLMRLLKVKHLARYRTATMRWLRYIESIENPPRSVAEIVRVQHINDILDASRPTLRRYLADLALTPDGRNDTLSALSTLFGLHFTSRGLDERLNPIRFDLDRFLNPLVRGKTPRTPLTPEALGRLKALNQRDRFAFSRSFRPSVHRLGASLRMGHYREVEGADGATLAWWPGFAVLLDLMLTLPLRGFQARWLDSGEGDEYELNPETLEEQPNFLPVATRGRRMGIFRAYPRGIGSDERLLGLNIATNKVPIDRDGRFGIPWCPDELRDALSLLAGWQRLHNSIAGPIPADEHPCAPGVRNEEVDALLPRVFPLFRDPARADGRPPTYQQVQTYWNQLCAAAEDEAAADGTSARLRLTRDRKREVNGNTILERVALHDLHSLRVSGITALIEAGLPPTMVQEIVGHMSVVMTLYYDKASPGQVNSALAQAFAAREQAVERLIAEAGEGREGADAALFNLRSAEDAAGPGMLRAAIGNGSHQVLTHGICPGGECRTGGEYSHLEKRHGSVPRAGACSVCRYRVTGPMFLAGLVVNANKIMFELHAKGQELRGLNDAIRSRRRQGQATSAFEARREILHRELEDLWAEWAAEHRYVQDSLHLLEEQTEETTAVKGLPVLSGEGALEGIGVRTERQHAFHLAQLLAEASAHAPSERHMAAIAERDAYLNEMLANNDAEPFLLRLDAGSRLAAGNLLGRLVASLVPDAELDGLRAGQAAPGRFKTLKAGIARLARQASRSTVNAAIPAIDGAA